MDIRESQDLSGNFGFAGLGGWQGKVSRGQKAPKNQGSIEPRDPAWTVCVCWRESQPFTLFGPAQGKVLTQFVKVQVARLATRQDGFDDIWRQESTAENLADITVCQSGIACQRSPIEYLSLNHPLQPAVSPRYGFDQRELRVLRRDTGVRWHDEMNFAAAPFSLGLDS